MTTPAPSSCATESREGSYESMEDDGEYNYERGSSVDHDDSFDASLEDTEKTPVVLPEQWRFMSPERANTALSRREEDVFEDEGGSPAPSAQPGPFTYRPQQVSAGSVDSNGQNRPLPPLPPTGPQTKSKSDSFSGAFERMSLNQRSLPVPPMATTISKADIQKMGTLSSLSGEDRLRLMALQEQERERRMRRMGSKDTSPVRNSSIEDPSIDHGEPGPEVSESRNVTPQISRASVLEGLRRQPGEDSRESSEDVLDVAQSRNFDPDVAIPSMEDPTQAHIKGEELEELDLYSIPDMYNRRSVSDSNASVNQDDDLGSQYSQASMAHLAASAVDEGQDTPKGQSPVRETASKSLTSERVSLPDFTEFGGDSSFDMGFVSYLSETETKVHVSAAPVSSNALPDLAALRQTIQRSYTPEVLTQQQNPRGVAVEETTPGTPDSVVKHPSTTAGHTTDRNSYAPRNPPTLQDESDRSISPSESGSVVCNRKEESPGSAVSPEFEAEPAAPSGESIGKAVNGENVRNDVQAMERKRVSSLVQLEIPQGELDEGLGLGLEKEFDRVVEAQKVEFELSLQRLYYPFNGRFPSYELPEPKDSKVANPMENVPVLPKPGGARALLGKRTAIAPDQFGVEESFANRAGRRQRGYLMRQNTKIVVASERIFQDEGKYGLQITTPVDEALAPHSPDANQVQPSPRKASQPTWTAEPWNGRIRRKSIRVGGEKVVTKRKPVEGPVPPLPGQASNAQETLDAVAEDELAEEDDWEDGAERGRLFVKVVGVKDLQMPFPQRKHLPFVGQRIELT